MKVLGVYNIKGRGTVVAVDTGDVPIGALKIGVLVWQGERAWKVTGVEMIRPSRPAGQVGLLLCGEGHDTVPETTELLL